VAGSIPCHECAVIVVAVALKERHASRDRCLLRVARALAALGLASDALAHHSFIGRFDLNALEIEGVVMIAWRNPHTI
jgi:hypothetical protein